MCFYYERQFFLCCIPKVGSLFTDTNEAVKLYSFEFCTFCKIWNPDQTNLVCSSLEIKLKLIADKSTLQFFYYYLLFFIYYFLLLFFTVAKSVFFSVYLIDITLLDEYLRLHMITKRHCYLKKFIFILRDFSNHHVVGFFETNVPVFSVISTITVKS